MPSDANSTRILLYAGGFAPLGGIESFNYDLLSSLVAKGVSSRLLCWGEESPMLRSLKDLGVPIVRQRFRWGCRWSLPDRLMLPCGLRTIAESDVIVFTKLLPHRCQQSIIKRKATKTRCQRRFIFITPYRPREMWGCSSPPTEILNSFDLVVVQSPDFHQDLRAAGYEGPVSCVPYLPPSVSNVVDLPESHASIRIGFLGRLAVQKNLGYLLEVFCDLVTSEQGRDAKWELLLFGDGAERPVLQYQAERLCLASRVHFCGRISRTGVANAIDRCHLFVLTSTTEGQCLAALEILARGRPLVATPVGALPHLLRKPELGRIAPISDSKAFADTIRDVLNLQRAGRLPPALVQRVFLEDHDRDRVLGEYMSLLVGPQTSNDHTGVLNNHALHDSQ